MRVTILGPNLRDQSKGEMHVHREGCGDIARMASREPEYRNGWTIEAMSRLAVSHEIYPPEDFDTDPELIDGSIYFFPCTSELS